MEEVISLDPEMGEDVKRWMKLSDEFVKFLLKRTNGKTTITLEGYMKALKEFVRERNLDIYDTLAIIGATSDELRPVIISILLRELIKAGDDIDIF